MYIDIITKNRFCYNYPSYAADKLSLALKKLGVAHRKLAISDGYLFSELAANPSGWIVCFSNVCELDRPIGDFFARPTLHWESLQLSYAYPVLESSHAIVGYFDPSVSHKKVHYLPHAVDIMLKSEEHRPFSVIMFESYITLKDQKATWQEVYTDHPKQPEAMMIKRDIQMATVVDQLVHTVEFPLHLFGEHVGASLFKRLPSNISLHGPQPYLELLKIASMSKILISHQIGDGFDSNFLSAIFSGCLVLTNETAALKQMVGDHTEIFYPTGDWKKLEERVRFFLDHPKKREQTVVELQKRLAKEHSWDMRTSQMLSLIKSQ